MTTTYAKSRRGPFLPPIWLVAFAALAGLCFLGFSAWVWSTADATTIIVIRHAEKESGGGDPPLSAAGMARAALLARLFGNPGVPGAIDAIYVSPLLRNRMTAEPLAARLRLTPIVAPVRDSGELAHRLLRDHAGGRILVVGHGDTVNEIVESLSGATDLPPIGDDEYGILYMVTVPRIGRPNLLRLTY